MNETASREIVYAALAAVNAERPDERQIPFSDDTPLLGAGAPIDSLEFINLVAHIEERLYLLKQREIQLTRDLHRSDEAAAPFRTVATLISHVDRQLAD